MLKELNHKEKQILNIRRLINILKNDLEKSKSQKEYEDIKSAIVNLKLQLSDIEQDLIDLDRSL